MFKGMIENGVFLSVMQLFLLYLGTNDALSYIPVQLTLAIPVE